MPPVVGSGITLADVSHWRRLSRLPGHEVAEFYGLSYDGDVDPIEHGGTFFNPERWFEDDGCDVIEFYESPKNGRLVVQRGRAYRSDERVARACESMGQPVPTDARLQIIAVLGYWGYEPDSLGYPDVMSFDLDTWKRWRVWKNVDKLLGSIT